MGKMRIYICHRCHEWFKTDKVYGHGSRKICPKCIKQRGGKKGQKYNRTYLKLIGYFKRKPIKK